MSWQTVNLCERWYHYLAYYNPSTTPQSASTFMGFQCLEPKFFHLFPLTSSFYIDYRQLTGARPSIQPHLAYDQGIQPLCLINSEHKGLCDCRRIMCVFLPVFEVVILHKIINLLTMNCGWHSLPTQGKYHARFLPGAGVVVEEC